MSFIVVIPARYASTRFPGKPLADIAGKPMVVRVAERARASAARDVVIATDHDEIERVGRAHGYPVVITRADHASGTDRIAEVVERLGCGDDEIVVNVQGDEPLIEPASIDLVARELEADRDASLATAAYPVRHSDEFVNPNAVKVVCDARGRALYFSRASIPFPRDDRLSGHALTPRHALRHIGLYAYRAAFLRRFAQLSPSPLEQIEALEQLRALWHGFAIRVALCDAAPEGGVDTTEDLARVRKKFDG